MGTEYVKQGVLITSDVLIGGTEAAVEYTGLLSESGAEKVYMFWGYEDQWKSPGHIEMVPTSDGFRAVLNVDSNGRLKLAFKDNAGNWDNNAGKNYSFRVH